MPSGIAVCFHAGQGCAIQTRMLLPGSRYDEGVEILKATLSSVAYGDPQRPDVLMGPVISAKQRDRVLGYIEKGVEEGATLALGGGRPADLPKGWFVEPTLFTDVDNSMTIAQEEIFGPVLVVIPFEDDDDAVRIANDSVYGLSGGVFSGSLERSLRVAERIRTGTFAVNGGMPIGQADIPFGGYKHSGIGRQNGLAGFDQYLETKSVAWPTPAVSRSPGPTHRDRADHTAALREHGYHELRVKDVVAETHDASSFVLDVPGRPGGDVPLPARAVLHLPGARRRRGAAALVLHVERAGDRRRPDGHGQAGGRRAGLQLVPRPRPYRERRGGHQAGRRVLPAGSGAARAGVLRRQRHHAGHVDHQARAGHDAASQSGSSTPTATATR